jgi:Na+-transporting methylmalonyl-CoA/oxaloacetate decarboxylase gamma subunit
VALQARLFLVDVPLVVTGLGMVFSLLLLAYFRGRRMRLFYNQPRQADHG